MESCRRYPRKWWPNMTDNITIPRTELRAAIVALDHIPYGYQNDFQRKTVEALRTSLALHDMNKAAEENGEEL